MASRDVLVLNTTASRAETQQGSDTVAIRGNSSQVLSVENSSGTSVLSVDSYSSSIQLTGDITASGNISSSLSSTASIGRLEATTLIGSAFNLTGTAIEGTISSSAQIAPYISGSFRRGFEFTGTIGDQPGGLDNKITASFGRIVGVTLSGSAANLTNTDLDNTISSSAQIASQISGAFTSGFNFDGKISGSVTSTGSFARIDAITLAGDGTELTNTTIDNTISSSAQIASQISGSFIRGFEFEGTITSSAGTTNKISVGKIEATTIVGDISNMTNVAKSGFISSSAQIASNISGSFNKGFEFDGSISGSATSTGSFARLVADSMAGDISAMSNIFPRNTVSSSAQLASNISGSFKAGFEYTGTIQGLKSWAFGTPMNKGHMEHGATGNKANALVFGGYMAPGGIATTDSTEEWNGSNWSYGGDLITARTCMAAFGISTEAAIAAGGSAQDSEEYNGSAWSEIADTIVNTRGGGGTGTTEAGIVAGRTTSPYQQTETFNGTNWSEVNDLITGNVAGFGRMIGTQNAGYYKHPGAGGNTSLCTQEWNGTNWSEVNNSNTQRTGGGGFAGSANDAWLAGGHPNTPATTEEWDGTAWSNLPASSDLNCIRRYSFGIGLPSTGMQTGGQENPNVSPYADNVVEEFTHATTTGSFSHVVATTITGDVSGMTGTAKAGFVSGSAQLATSISGSFNQGFRFSGSIQKFEGVWSAGGNLISAKREAAGIGTKAGALVVGGTGTVAESYIADTEEYNGTSFSEVNNLITARCGVMGAGTTEAGIIMGGEKTAPGTTGCTEVYNGTNWSEEADMNYCTKNSGDAGDSSEAAIVFGGNFNTPVSHYTGQSEEYNGTTWSEINSLNVSRTDLAGLGNSESALAVAGCPPPGGHAPGNGYDVEEWNGTNWSEVADTLIDPHLNTEIKGSGTVNDGHAFGGFYRIWPSTYVWNGTRSQHFDGTAWAYGGGLIQGRSFGAGDGTSGNNSFYAGGRNPGIASPYLLPNMEEYSRAFTSGSFGRLEAVCVRGDISNMTGINSPTILTGSSQIAARISGSFNSGFNFTGTIQNEPYTFTEVAALNVGRQSLGASGIKTAGLVFGGMNQTSNPVSPYTYASTETFDGSSWSEVNDLIAGGRGIGGSGTSNATVAFGGHPTRNQYTEEWNGTNWSEVNDMIRSDFACQAADIGQSSEAAIAAGSCTTRTQNDSAGLCNEEWNGTNWATAGALIHQASQTGGGAGTANAGMTAGGFILPGYPGAHRCTQLWNGVNWSESEAALPPSNFRGILYGWGGSQNDAIITSGCSYQGGLFDTSYCYNGISWSAGSGVGTLSGANSAGVYRHKGAGTTVDNSFFAGGVVGGAGGNTGAANVFCTDNGFASASFSHIEATRISASVDGMTNIPEPAGTISGSAQIASSVSGSFNKGFEFSGEVRSLGVWSSGGEFPGNLKHTYHSAVWGTQNSALLGGGIGIYQSAVCDTYSYNGTSWSDTGANMNDSKGGYTGHGTENAALAAGGIQYRSHIFQYLRINTEEWNGSAWSFTTNLPHQLAFLNNQKGGTQNAALIAGGYTGNGSVNQGSGSEAYQKSNLDWDGLSFTIGAPMANERGSGGFVGTMNAGLAQGGTELALAGATCTEEWNGSAWSTAAASNFQTAFTQTVGTSNNAMHITDTSSPVREPKSDFYNGVSWQLGPNAGLSSYPAPKQCTGAAGSTSAGLFMTYNSSCVEHFDENHTTSSMGRVDATKLSIESDADLTVNDSFQLPIFAANPPVTSSAGEVWYNRAEEKLYFTYDINAWTSTAELITAGTTQYFGTTGAGIAASRYHYPGIASPHNSAVTEEWDGNAWSETGDTIHCGQSGEASHIAVGTSYAGLILGVNLGPAKVQKWNGSTWSEETALDYGCAYGNSVAGTQNAAVSAGGRNGSHFETTKTVEYNGTSGYAAADMPTGYASLGVAGTQNDSYFWAGDEYNPVGTANCDSLNYNGTSWATGATTLRNHFDGVSAGTANAALAAGGKYIVGSGDHGGYVCVEEYNGTAWYNVNNLNVAQRGPGGDGSQSSAFAVGKRTGFAMNSESSETEQYTTTGIGCHCIGGV